MPCKLPTRPGVQWRPSHHRLLSKTATYRWTRPQPIRWSRINLVQHDQRRQFSLTSIPTVLLPPVVFTGLLITLWTYKCLMMIIFQNKIIYMPGMPPFSRSEKVEDYANGCKPVSWTEHSTKSGDGTRLKMLEGKIPYQEDVKGSPSRRHVVVVYFQGNASSLPPRLPYLSSILKLLQKPDSNTQYSLVALSYRGFWKSKGRPNQRGIELDAQAALQWVAEQYNSIPNTKFILWGQSIGAGVATTALATWQEGNSQLANEFPVVGLLLETPFTSLRAMLIALYPQKFLPYRYLGPFLMSTWDSEDALSRISRRLEETDQMIEKSVDNESNRLKVLLLEAENDELVPKEDATTLYTLCAKSKKLDVEHKVVAGALHTDVMMKNEGKKEIVRFLRGFESVT